MADRPEHSETTAEARGQAVEAYAARSDVSEAARIAGVDEATFRRWLDSNAEINAEINRARLERASRLRAEVRELASEAMASLRELVSDPNTPPAIRLRASLAVLQASEATKAETIGPTDPAAIRSEWNQRDLLSRIGLGL
ncbi:hypothetical protein [Tautonia rosea]|uniref:hypothetical protein n=1 Tax=Tautonia rosea TaxID=2728037 RepID=UPI0014734662|nr:hypothetical protein [Tautonia rosea]